MTGKSPSLQSDRLVPARHVMAGPVPFLDQALNDPSHCPDVYASTQGSRLCLSSRLVTSASEQPVGAGAVDCCAA